MNTAPAGVCPGPGARRGAPPRRPGHGPEPRPCGRPAPPHCLHSPAHGCRPLWLGRLPMWWRRWLGWALGVLGVLGLLPLAAAAASTGVVAAPPLLLQPGQASVALWPHTRVRILPLAEQPDVQAVLAQPEAFGVPTSPHATLGMRTHEHVWLRVALALHAQAPSHWIFDLDYSAINGFDAYLVSDTPGAAPRVLQQWRLGQQVPVAERPLQSRTHSLPLDLLPGQRYVLLLHVTTRSPYLLPMRLSQPAHYHAAMLDAQMLQGLFLALALCLLGYSLVQWRISGEALFAKYALLTTGSALFVVQQQGIGMQFFWPDAMAFDRYLGVFASSLALAGTFWFLEDALRTVGRGRWFSRVMHTGAAVVLAVAVLNATRLLPTGAAVAVLTLVTPLPSLIALPRMVRGVRRRSALAIYLLLAWLVYLVAASVLAATIHGRLPVNFWTLHSFQFGATFDMLAFLVVLVLRTRAQARASSQAQIEQALLHAHAHTDPLTGLANRRGLQARLEALLPQASAGHALAVYMIDLDGFKAINDQWGHEAGDELLFAIGQQLRQVAGADAMVARLGGDEFVVLASGLGACDPCAGLGQRLLAVGAPDYTVLGTLRVRVGLSIGCARAPDAGVGSSAADAAALLRRADQAMYQAKHSGKGRLVCAATPAGSPEI